jgi:anti-sigma factor RsiW
MPATREAQIERWRKMRRTGKVRYVLVRGLGAGLLMATAMAASFWSSGQGALLGFGVGAAILGPIGLALAHGEWKRFEKFYPDIS